MADLVRLDRYLSSDDGPESCMMLSDLDGFLHGVACSPVEISTAEWMRCALGVPPTTAPAWVLEEIGSRYSEILEGLLAQPSIVEPIFWQAKEGPVIAMDWCEGFMEAVGLRAEKWLRLSESGKDSYLLTPVLAHLLDDNGNSALGIPQEDLEAALNEAAAAIPETTVGIFQFWRTVGAPMFGN